MFTSRHTAITVLALLAALCFIAAPAMADHPWDLKPEGKGKPTFDTPLDPNGHPMWDEQMLIDEGLLPVPPQYKQGQLPSVDDHPWSGGGGQGGSGDG